MKKLLTILLTLVMAIGLVVLNNNHIKAENDKVEFNKGLAIVDDELIFEDSSAVPSDVVSYDNSTKTLTFKKEVVVTTNSNLAMNLDFGKNSTLIINLNNNLTLDSSGGTYYAIYCNKTNTEIVINGNGNYLTLKSNSGFALNTMNNGKVTLNNVKLRVEENGYGYPLDIKKLTLNNSDVIINAPNGSYGILRADNEGWAGINTAKGKAADGVLVDVKKDLNDYFVPVSSVDDTQITYYIEINYVEPKPEPSPSEPVVKDESCEKVIGPTWHWNNDKGICEEYATVGTATR